MGILAVGKPETLEQAADDLAMILASLQTMRDGNFSVRLPVAWPGLKGKIADTFNDIIAVNERIALELNRVGQAIGKEGRTGSERAFSICGPRQDRQYGNLEPTGILPPRCAG
jgi:hypothetical protein